MSSDVGALSQGEARRVIESLRVGTVPAHQLETFTVGRQELLESLGEDLAFVSDGGSKVRLLAAEYGGGKTHLLSLLRQNALTNGFLVSYVELHSREAPFDKFEIIYSKMMQGLAAATSAAGVEEALAKWTRSNRLYEAQAMEVALAGLTSLPDLRNAIRAYVSYSEGNSEVHTGTRNAVLGWLCGARLPSPLANRIGVRGPIGITNVSDVLRSFLALARASGFSGVVLLLDEAEAVTSLERSQRRNDANQNLRKLLDNAEINEGLYVVFATTPRFIDDQKRGARSYPALWDRIRPVLRLPVGLVDTRGTVIKLDPLGDDLLHELALRVLSIYAQADRWSQSPDTSGSIASRYVDTFQQSRERGSVRAFVRGWLIVLDAIETAGDPASIDAILSAIAFDDDEEQQ